MVVGVCVCMSRWGSWMVKTKRWCTVWIGCQHHTLNKKEILECQWSVASGGGCYCLHCDQKMPHPVTLDSMLDNLWSAVRVFSYWYIQLNLSEIFRLSTSIWSMDSPGNQEITDQVWKSEVNAYTLWQRHHKCAV